MKKILPSNQNHGPVRTAARKSKLAALTAGQSQALLRWLNQDKVTYAVAREKLLNKFGVSLSIWAISTFWHRHNAPQAPVSANAETLIELVIHAGRRCGSW